MSLPGFIKHLRALEDAGLLRREKAGRVVTCTLDAQPMRDAMSWLTGYEAFWSERGRWSSGWRRAIRRFASVEVVLRHCE